MQTTDRELQYALIELVEGRTIAAILEALSNVCTADAELATDCDDEQAKFTRAAGLLSRLARRINI